MIRLSNLADYAVVVMTAAAKSDAPRLTAAAVAGVTGLPEPTVSKLMGSLARAGLLSSTRGVSGGFAMARDADAITVVDIIEAVDGPIAMTACAHASSGDCVHEDGCAVRPHWLVINRSIREALSVVTLAEIAGVKSRKLVEA